jgi:Trypsin-co-occurring domain 1
MVRLGVWYVPGTQVIEISLPSGGTILAQVYRTSASGPVDVSLSDRLPSIDGLTDALRDIGQAVARAWEGIRPDKASVEFGLNLAVKSGGLTALLVAGETPLA